MDVFRVTVREDAGQWTLHAVVDGTALDLPVDSLTGAEIAARHAIAQRLHLPDHHVRVDVAQARDG